MADPKQRDQVEVLNAKISLNVMPLLKDVHQRSGALIIIAWCQTAGIALAVILAALVLAKVF